MPDGKNSISLFILGKHRIIQVMQFPGAAAWSLTSYKKFLLAAENPILEVELQKMGEPTNEIEDGINIHLPVKIQYHVLEAFLRDKMKGEKIKAEKNGEVTTYAEILDFSLEKSQKADFDLDVYVKYRTLTTFFKNKQGEVLVNLSLYFDEAAQELLVTDYKLKGNSGGWLMNKVLPSVINTFMHKKLKSKMRFAFKQKIDEQVKSLNEKLRQKIKATEGISVTGELSTTRISDIIVGKSHFLVSVEIKGTGLVEISEIRMNKK